jgi:type IV pilus assembly protein PilE
MNRQKGFTLVELMVALVIVALLAAMAMPSYRSHVIKTRRATAAACLVELSQFMERTYNVSLRYDKADSGGKTDTTLPDYQCQKELADYYTFTLSNLDAKKFTLTAAPRSPAQVDPQCGNLILVETGVKKTSIGTDAAVKTCWK